MSRTRTEKVYGPVSLNEAELLRFATLAPRCLVSDVATSVVFGIEQMLSLGEDSVLKTRTSMTANKEGRSCFTGNSVELLIYERNKSPADTFCSRHHMS